jgi:NitT/TauT family transport system substrate-binding protein
VLGTVPWLGTEPFFLARDEGLFPSAVHLTEYMNSTHKLRAFHNGVIDAAAVTLEEVVNLNLGGQVQVVLVLDSSNGADCVVARPEVKTLADLKGKRVGAEDVMLPTYVLHRALEQVKLKVADVQRVHQGPAESAEALRRGEVDAVVGYEPYCQRMVAEGGHVLFDSTRIPGEIVDVLVVRRAYLEANPAQVDALVRGWFAALARLRERPQESVRKMGPRLGIPEENFLQALKGVHYPDAQEQRTLLAGDKPRLPETIERLRKVMVQYTGVSSSPIPGSVIDPAPLLRVAP